MLIVADFNSNREDPTMRFMFTMLMALVVHSLAFSSGVEAQQPRHPLAKLGADMLQVKNGPRLLGAIVEQDEESVKIAVEREWLEKTYPKFYATHLKDETQAAKAGRTELEQKLVKWKELRNKDVGLRVYLDQRINKLKDADFKPSSFFVMVKLNSDRVARHYKQPSRRKRALLLAWQHDVPKASIQSALFLERKLSEKKIDLQSGVQLANKLPKTQMTPKQWATHVAAIEYRLRQKMNFQGTGEYIVQTGDKAKEVDIKQVFQTMLNRELKRVLGKGIGPDQKNKDKWKETATAAAEKAGLTGVRVTRLWQNINSGRVEVHLHFLARMDNGSWEVVYEDMALAKASQQDAKARKKVEAAPEVKKILDIAKQLGLNPDDKRIQLALQFGSATQAGQTAAHERFDNFIEAHVKW